MIPAVRSSEDSKSTAFPRAACFLSGFVLYNVVVVFVGGMLAAITIPHAYFEWFGDRKTPALILEEGALYALPVFVLCTAWSLVTTRILQDSGWKPAVIWTLVGFAAAWIAWLAAAGLLTPALVVPPVWGILNLVAGPLGIIVAGVLASPTPRACAERTA